MAQTVSIIITFEDRLRLAAVIEDRNSPQKHVQRARIVLLSADRLPVLEVARQIGGSRPAVWRWQLRYAEQGVDGILRDKSRKPGKPPVQLEAVARMLALPCSEPPRNATHWTGRAGRQGCRQQPADGSTHLGRASPSAPPLAHLQEIQRSGLCREGGGRRRPLYGASLPCRGAVH